MIQLDVEVNAEALDEFIEYRTTVHKKKPSDLAIKKLANKLMANPEGHARPYEVQQQMVDRSIENDWKGLFEPEIKQEVALVTNQQEGSFIEKHTDTSWAAGIPKTIN